MDRIARLPTVKAHTGLSRTTIYQMIQDGRFPKQVRLGPKSVGWFESDVEAWLDSRRRIL